MNQEGPASQTGKYRCSRCQLMKPHTCLGQRWPNDAVWDFDNEADLHLRSDSPIDALVAKHDEEYAASIYEEMTNAIALSHRCKSCGATGSQFNWKHAPGCDLDRTLTAGQRYAHRNPGRTERFSRKMKIKRRWAILRGLCSVCTTRKPSPDRRACDLCRSANTASHARMRERQRMAARVTTVSDFVIASET